MPTPFESAQLNLQLFDLRRESVLREARAWFLRDFNPESFAELAAVVSGGRNAAFRMVLGYWDMAASLVTTGAVDADAFLAAHGEIFGAFSKSIRISRSCAPPAAKLTSANIWRPLCLPPRTRKRFCPGAGVRSAPPPKPEFLMPKLLMRKKMALHPMAHVRPELWHEIG
jgi:hypothetical protein